MNNSTTTLFKASTVKHWLDSMVEPMLSRCLSAEPVALIGIRRGGVDVSRYLHKAMLEKGAKLTPEMGELNIAFYRDDFSSIGLHPVVGPSHVPFDITGMHIILVDDVLGTGRTVRAAMNEIFDFGRPARITLAVLVQRDDHELPIRADVVGHELNVATNEHVFLDTEQLEVSIGVKS